MECVFAQTAVPADFAGGDLADDRTMRRLSEFKGRYSISCGEAFVIEDDEGLVVATIETLAFLKKLSADEQPHALTIFRPLMFGRRSGDEVLLTRFHSSRPDENRDLGILENVKRTDICAQADDVETYLKDVLLINYPQTLYNLLRHYSIITVT